MKSIATRPAFILLGAVFMDSLAVTACARQPEATDRAAATTVQPATPVATDAAGVQVPQPAGTSLPPMVVHKSASCGCCGLWVDHMRAAGFQVEVRNEDNLNPIKERLGVPYGKGSCHTAEIAGYVVEGHVPAEDIKRLLNEKSDARGLVLPGMPLGSPGMEVPDGTVQPYTVELVRRDGITEPYAQHGQ